MKKIILLIVISILSFVNCQNFNTVQINLSEGTRVKLNSAFEKNNLLSTEWQLFPGKPTFVNFTIRLENVMDEIYDECILQHNADPEIDMIELTSIQQLSKRHVIVEWKHWRTDRPINYGTETRKILIIDTLPCKYVRNITYPLSIKKIPKDLIVFYDEGFDVIIHGWDCGAATNCRESYDIYGKKLYAVNFLPLKFDWITWQSVSEKSRFKGFFARCLNSEENTPTQVFLAGNNGVKKLLDLPSRNEVKSHAESDQWYVICGRDIYNVESICCAQYHILKNKVFDRKMILKQMRIIAVRGLNKGGVILFTVDGDKKLMVAEMTTVMKIREYELKWRARENGDFVILSSESMRTFIVAYESEQPKHKIVIETFDFPVSF